jgi:hypothetical protein
MTIFAVVLAVLYVSLRMRAWLRDRYTPWYETWLQERAQGLPRGSLAERWQTPGNGMSDEAWVWVLRNVNNATRDERKQLLRQR